MSFNTSILSTGLGQKSPDQTLKSAKQLLDDLPPDESWRFLNQALVRLQLRMLTADAQAPRIKWITAVDGIVTPNPPDELSLALSNTGVELVTCNQIGDSGVFSLDSICILMLSFPGPSAALKWYQTLPPSWRMSYCLVMVSEETTVTLPEKIPFVWINQTHFKAWSEMFQSSQNQQLVQNYTLFTALYSWATLFIQQLEARQKHQETKQKMTQALRAFEQSLRDLNNLERREKETREMKQLKLIKRLVTQHLQILLGKKALLDGFPGLEHEHALIDHLRIESIGDNKHMYIIEPNYLEQVVYTLKTRLAAAKFDLEQRLSQQFGQLDFALREPTSTEFVDDDYWDTQFKPDLFKAERMSSSTKQLVYKFFAPLSLLSGIMMSGGLLYMIFAGTEQRFSLYNVTSAFSDPTHLKIFGWILLGLVLISGISSVINHIKETAHATQRVIDQLRDRLQQAVNNIVQRALANLRAPYESIERSDTKNQALTTTSTWAEPPASDKMLLTQALNKAKILHTGLYETCTQHHMTLLNELKKHAQ